MSSLKPDIYQKNIFNISYSKLKKQNVKLLLFDLDNTIIPFYEKIVPLKTKKLFDSLKEDFKIMVISNSRKKRVSYIASQLGVPYISFSKKPFPHSYNKAIKINGLKKEETIIIGDQMFTDILAGKRVSIKTALVEPLSI